jgi:2,3-bisphosphoglycerate-dependent phosphoglycerate mutase
MSTQIVLIRHGETDWNVEGRIQGHLQIPLNRRGRAQAESLGTHLQGTRFDAVYSSDLLRALQTAQAIVRHSGHEIREDMRLREWDLGVLAGLRRTQAEHDQPRAARIRRDYLVDEPIPGGESIRQRFARVTAAVSDIAVRHRGECVLVVSHGGPIGDCYRRATGNRIEERMKIDLFNASINQVYIDSDDWSLASWAQIDHLAAIGSLPNWEGRSKNEDS